MLLCVIQQPHSGPGGVIDHFKKPCSRASMRTKHPRRMLAIMATLGTAWYGIGATVKVKLKLVADEPRILMSNEQHFLQV